MKNSELRKTIGQRIAAALALRGRKQLDLAKYLGMNEKTANAISYYCKGTRTPNTDQLTKIAKYLDVSADYILGLKVAPTNNTTLQAVCEYTGLTQEAVEELHRMRTDNLKLISDFILLCKTHNNTHAKWFGTVCSACGESTSWNYDCEYCPHCGAKMDE